MDPDSSKHNSLYSTLLMMRKEYSKFNSILYSFDNLYSHFLAAEFDWPKLENRENQMVMVHLFPLAAAILMKTGLTCMKTAAILAPQPINALSWAYGK